MSLRRTYIGDKMCNSMTNEQPTKMEGVDWTILSYQLFEHCTFSFFSCHLIELF